MSDKPKENWIQLGELFRVVTDLGVDAARLVISPVELAGGGLSIRFMSLPGKVYDLERAHALGEYGAMSAARSRALV